MSKVLSQFLVFVLAIIVARPVFAQELKLVTDDGPPHMIRETDGGLDIDITRAVLERAGFSVQIQYTALARAKRSVQNRMADVVVPTFFEEDETGYYVSAPVVNYRPTIFTRAEDGYDLRSFADIKDLRVVTFQGAEGYFGEKFTEMAKQNTYVELHDMSALPLLLARGRADVIVLDYFIFRYHWGRTVDPKLEAAFKAHTFMPTIPAYVGFNDPEIRDRFNAALAGLIAEGERHQIVARYLFPDGTSESAQ